MNPVNAIGSSSGLSPTIAQRGVRDVVSAEPAPSAAPSSPAGYISPRIRFDREIDRLIIEIRDIQSGEVQQSFPPKSTVEAYQRAARTGYPVVGDFSARPDPGTETGTEPRPPEPAPETGREPVRPTPAPTGSLLFAEA